MKRLPVRRVFLGLIAAGLAAASAFAADPRMILVVSVDQMRYDYLSRFAPLYKGGFKRLLDNGAVFTNARYRHAATETGPGHSVILSGRHASSTGIVANEWWDPVLKRAINVVDDPTQTTVGGPGRSASPTNFVGFTLGDKIKQKWPNSRVLGISIKDRAAILMSGRRSDGAFWFETACGCFITSSYYAKQPPAWLTAFNARKLPDSFLKTPWTRLLSDTAIYDKYVGPDDFPGEPPNDGTFPHEHRAKPPASAYYSGLLRSPFSDQMVLEAALAAMDAYRLGAGGSPDLLAVSFSGPDSIGHAFGPHSHEAMDEFLRLDFVLERLISAVEQRTGAGNYLMVLAADHGATPTVEWLKAHDKPSQRYNPAIISDAIRNVVADRYPLVPNLIANISGADVYFDLDVMDKAGLNRADVEGYVIEAMMTTGLLDRVYTHADLIMTPSGKDPYLQLFKNSFFAPRAPHLLGLQKEFVYLTTSTGGTGHGTVYDNDRHIPVVFMGPGIPKGQFEAPAGPEDIAPTLARILNIDYPLEADARLLTEILK